MTRTWNEDTITDLLKRFNTLDPRELAKHRKDYPGLLRQDTKEPRTWVIKTHHRLIFHRSDGRTFNEEELDFLLGPRWSEWQKESEADPTLNGPLVLGPPDIRYDLAHVPVAQRLSSHFNILSQGRGVLVRDSNRGDPIEIPPAINLAISLTSTAIKKLRGGFFWQPKREGVNLPRWNVVPGVIYSDIA